MFIRLDKEDSYYRNGETVKGSVFFELFHQSAQNELFIKFEGVQIVPKHVKKMIETGIDELADISNDEDSMMGMSSRNSIAKVKINEQSNNVVGSDESIESFRGYKNNVIAEPKEGEKENQRYSNKVKPTIVLNKTGADLMK